MQKCVVSCTLLDGEGMYAPDYKDPDIIAAVRCGDEVYKTDKFSTVNPKWMSHFTIGKKTSVSASTNLVISVLHGSAVVLGSVSIALESILGRVAQKLQLPLRGGTLEDNGDAGCVRLRQFAILRTAAYLLCVDSSRHE